MTNMEPSLSSIQPARPKWSDKKLLLFEEDEISVMLIKELLVNTGIKIKSYTHYDESLSELDNKKKYNLIILNYSPIKNSTNDLLELIRNRFPEVPVIFTSSIPYQMLDNKHLYINGSIKQLLLKPLKVKELFQAIDTYII